MSAIQCPQCSGKLAKENLDFDRGVADCPWCQSLFRFQARAKKSAPKPQAPTRARVAMPRGIKVHDDGVELLIERRWFSAATIFLTFFAVFWNGIVSVFVFAAITNANPVIGLFITGHLAIGLGVAYFALCGYVNTTRLRVSDHELSVVHQPLPWPGKMRMPRNVVDQLYCKKHVRHGKNGTQVSYEVYALSRSSVRRRLLKGLQSEEQALFIEQRVEEFLGLEDRRVAGAHV